MNYLDVAVVPMTACWVQSTRATDCKESDMHLFNADARNISEILRNDLVDVTLTSPPYFDVKDYGHKGQIGFGQSYNDYLSDLADVFKGIYSSTKETGSLWVVIDTFHRNGEVIPLPFDLATRLNGVRWALVDIIIWKKDKTLPWVGKNTTRGIFEYLLVFAKNKKKMKYFPDRLRDHTDLKQWWVKYPERYNPNGKAADEVWEIGIPVQGAWGKNTPRHLCPLPTALVRRVLRLSTDKGDMVLDPFAGTGVVLSEAVRLGRKSLGCEIVEELVTEFKARPLPNVEIDCENVQHDSARQFYEKIIDLRRLKFGRLLYKNANKFAPRLIRHIIAVPSSREIDRANKVASVDLFVLLWANVFSDEVRGILDKLVNKKPFSKFGLDANIVISPNDEYLVDRIASSSLLFCYSKSNSHKYVAKVFLRDVLSGAVSYPLLSTIGVSIDEDDES